MMMTSHQLAKILLSEEDLPIVFVDGDNKHINLNSKGEADYWERIDIVDDVRELPVYYHDLGETKKSLILTVACYAESEE